LAFYSGNACKNTFLNAAEFTDAILKVRAGKKKLKMAAETLVADQRYIKA